MGQQVGRAFVIGVLTIQQLQQSHNGAAPDHGLIHLSSLLSH